MCKKLKKKGFLPTLKNLVGVHQTYENNVGFKGGEKFHQIKINSPLEFIIFKFLHSYYNKCSKRYNVIYA